MSENNTGPDPGKKKAPMPAFRRVGDTEPWRQLQKDLADAKRPADYDADGLSPRGVRIAVGDETEDETVTEQVRVRAAQAQTAVAAARSRVEMLRHEIAELARDARDAHERAESARVNASMLEQDPDPHPDLIAAAEREADDEQNRALELQNHLDRARADLNASEHELAAAEHAAAAAAAHVHASGNLQPAEQRVRMPKRPATIRLARALTARMDVRPAEAELIAAAALNPERVRRQLAEELDADESKFGATFTVEFDAFTVTMLPLLLSERLSVAKALGQSSEQVLPMPGKLTGSFGLGLVVADRPTLVSAGDQALAVLADTGSLGRSIAKDGVLEHLHAAPMSVWLPGERRERLMLGVWDGGRRIATCLHKLGLTTNDVLTFAEDEAARRSWLGQQLKDGPTLSEARRAGLVVRVSVTVKFEPAEFDLSLLDAVTARRNITHLTVPASVPNVIAQRLAILDALRRHSVLFGLPEASPLPPDPQQDRPSRLMQTATPDVQAVWALKMLTDPSASTPTVEDGWEAAGRTLGRRLRPHGQDLAAALSGLMLEGLGKMPLSSIFTIDRKAVSNALHDVAVQAVALYDQDRNGADRLNEALEVVERGPLFADDFATLAAEEYDERGEGALCAALLLRGGFYLAAHGFLDDLPPAADRGAILERLVKSDQGRAVLTEAIRAGVEGLPCPVLNVDGQNALKPEEEAPGVFRVVWQPLTGQRLHEIVIAAGEHDITVVDPERSRPDPARNLRQISRARRALRAAVAAAEEALLELAENEHKGHHGAGEPLGQDLADRLAAIRDHVVIHAARNTGQLPPLLRE